MIELVTGHTGTGHVSSADERAYRAGVLGDRSHILGAPPALTMQDANTLEIGACEMQVQGAHVRITGTESVAIENGTAGSYRRDLIMVRYEIDAATGVESCELHVATGEASDTLAGAVDPVTDYSQASILDGAYIVDVPLVRVTLTSLAPAPELVMHPTFPLFGSDGGAAFNVRSRLGQNVTGMFNSGEFSREVAAGTFGNLACGQVIEKPCTIDGTAYTARAWLLDADTFFAGYNNKAAVDTHHVAAMVAFYDASGNPLKHNWNSTNTTEGGYSASSLHSYIQSKLVPAIKAAFGESHLVKHSCLLSNATASGKSSNYTWFDDLYAVAPSAAQFGQAISGVFYDVGEAYKTLAAFDLFDANRLMGNQAIWARDVLAAGNAALLHNYGVLSYGNASTALCAVPLILLK